jgi:hypothetical protein
MPHVLDHPYLPDRFLAGRSRWRRAGRVMAVMLLVALAAYVAVNVTGGRQIAVELGRIRAEGAPVSLREAAPPAIPEEENAAPIYDQAFLALPRLERSPGQSAELPPRLANADGTVVTNLLSENPARRARVTPRELEQALAGTDAALALARRAAAMPRCRFPIDWEAGAAALFPHYAKLRSLTRLLGGRAVLSAREGRPADAAADLEAMAGIAAHAGVDPVLIGQLVQYACLSHYGSALQQVMETASLDEADCRRLEARLSEIDLPARFARAVETERCFGLWAFDTARRDRRLLAEAFGDRAGPPAGLHAAWVVLAEPFLKWDEIAYLRLMSRQVARARDARPLLPGEADGPLTETTVDGRPPWFAVVSRLMLPALAQASAKRDAAVARLALMRAALALEACRAREGRYPVSLGEAERLLGRALPRDPFTETPLRYQRRDAGYLLYSVGANRCDDGGRGRLRATAGTLPGPSAPEATFQPRPGGPDDIVWHIGR